jgi:hypothetical protein
MREYDSYRLRLERNADRVRLITKGGYDWTKRYPRIVESALKNRHKHFVIDGEAIVRGVDGYSDFNALHSGKHNEEVELIAFDVLAMDGDDLRSPPLTMRKTNLQRLLGGVRMASSCPTSSRERSAPIFSARPVSSDWRAWFRSARTGRTEAAARRTGSRSRTASTMRSIGSKKAPPRRHEKDVPAVSRSGATLIAATHYRPRRSSARAS